MFSSKNKTTAIQPVLNELMAFRSEMEAINWQTGGVLENDRHKFILLLSGLSSCRISPGWNGPKGCVATDRITVDGMKVGYMYREEPDYKGDSGWRFTAGDESDEYMDNPKNSGIYDLNTICNDDPEIIEFLNSETGSSFERVSGGPLQHIPEE